MAGTITAPDGTTYQWNKPGAPTAKDIKNLQDYIAKNGKKKPANDSSVPQNIPITGPQGMTTTAPPSAVPTLENVLTKGGPPALSKGLGLLGKTLSASEVGLKGLSTLATGNLQGASTGIQQGRTWGSPLRESGHPVLGFAADVLGDPTTYLAGGIGKKAAKAVAPVAPDMKALATAAEHGISLPAEAVAKSNKVRMIAQASKAADVFNLVASKIAVSKAKLVGNVNDILANIAGNKTTAQFGQEIGQGWLNLKKYANNLYHQAYDMVDFEATKVAEEREITRTTDIPFSANPNYEKTDIPMMYRNKKTGELFNPSMKARGMRTEAISTTEKVMQQSPIANQPVNVDKAINNLITKSAKYKEAEQGGKEVKALIKWLRQPRTLSEIRSKAEVLGEDIYQRASNKLVNPPAEDKILKSAVHDLNDSLFDTLQRIAPNQAQALQQARLMYRQASQTVMSDLFKHMPELVNNGRWSEIGRDFVGKVLEPEDVDIIKQIKNQYGQQGQVFYDGIKASVVNGLLEKAQLAGEKGNQEFLTAFSKELTANKDVYEKLFSPVEMKKLEDTKYLKGILDKVRDVKGSGKSTTMIATGAALLGGAWEHSLIPAAVLAGNTFLNSKLGQLYLTKGIAPTMQAVGAVAGAGAVKAIEQAGKGNE